MFVYREESGGLCASLPSLQGRLRVHLPVATLEKLGATQQPLTHYAALWQHVGTLQDALVRVVAIEGLSEITLQPWHLRVDSQP